jgi:hypothetical protein
MRWSVQFFQLFEKNLIILQLHRFNVHSQPPTCITVNCRVYFSRSFVLSLDCDLNIDELAYQPTSVRINVLSNSICRTEDDGKSTTKVFSPMPTRLRGIAKMMAWNYVPSHASMLEQRSPNCSSRDKELPCCTKTSVSFTKTISFPTLTRLCHMGKKN